MRQQKYGSHQRIALISTHGYVAATPPLGAADTGAQIVYVLELAKRLAEIGYEVDIFTRQFEIQAQIEECGERVHIVRIPCGGRDFIAKEHLYRCLDAWCANALRYIRLRGYLYAFLSSHYWDAGTAGQKLSRALAIPHIHTPHSLGVLTRRQMLNDHPELVGTFETEFNMRERIRHEREIYSSCDMVVAKTATQSETLARDYQVPVARIHVLPPGYDETRFFPVPKLSRELLRLRLGFCGKVVLALGRLTPEVRNDLLIDAFAVLAEREPDAKLFLALGGAELSYAEELVLRRLRSQAAKLRLTEKVSFSGHVPDRELADYFRAADLYVHSSMSEPFATTAIEAMACGTPTVITNSGDLFPLVRYGWNAMYADPFDRHDLGITMMKVLRHHNLRKRLSRVGAHQARSLFTWTRLAQQFVATVDTLGSLSIPQGNGWARP